MLRSGMMMAAMLAGTMLAGAATAAVPIAGLVNSGQIAGGGGVSSGTVREANWLMDGVQPWNSNTNNSRWIANNAVSRWMTPASNGNQSFDPTSDRLYLYTLNFDLTGFNPASASFSGRFAVDNEVTQILLNGTAITQGGLGAFNSWTAFSATGGFVGGLNTLAFTVRNVRQASGNPTGLRVEFLASSADAALSGGAVPEPASWAMMIAGFGMVGAMRRRRTGSVAA